MPSAQEIGRRLAEAVQAKQRQAKFPAKIGKVRPDGTVTIKGDLINDDRLPDGQVYVRRYGEDAEALVAYATMVKPQANLPVVCEYNYANNLVIAGVDDREAWSAFGEVAPAFAGGGGRLDQTDTLIGSRNYLVGRLRLATENSLVVTADSFFYRSLDGTLVWFNPDDETIDLTSNVPGTANQHRLVLVSLNPETGLLVATNGTAVSIYTPLTAEDVPSITQTAGYINLGAVRLVNGDTAITDSTRFIEAREFLNETYRLTVEEADASPSVTGVNTIVFDRMAVTDDGAGQVTVQPSSFDLFSQTANASVTNTTAETTILGTGVGSLTLPANYFAVGTRATLRMRGFLSDAVTPGDLTVRLKLGSTTVSEVTFTQVSSITDGGVDFEADIVCRSTGVSGTVVSGGLFEYATNQHELIKTSTTTIDTTVTQTVDLTVQYDTASVDNIITSQIAILTGGKPA